MTTRTSRSSSLNATVLIPSDEQALSFLKVVGGDPKVSIRVLKKWCVMAGSCQDAPANFLETETADKISPAQQKRRLEEAALHARELADRLDKRAAWNISIAVGLFKDMDASEKMERQILRLAKHLPSVADALDAAAAGLKIVRGPVPSVTPQTILSYGLRGDLIDCGVPDRTSERSKMVVAFQICWDIAGYGGDPRDFLRAAKLRTGRVLAASEETVPSQRT